MKNNKEDDIIKYETKNPISKMLIKGFFKHLDALLRGISFGSVFEAGCGNGYITEFIKNGYPDALITAIDIEEEKIEEAKKRKNVADFSVGSIYGTGQADGSFDLVVSTEVLEHLEDPGEALRELIRISKRYILISTPNEPLWSILNMARFKYIKSLGNTPGHIRHWNARGLRKFAGGYCSVREMRKPLPWTMLLCEKISAE